MQLLKKVCLLGIFGVGKTSLVRRFVYDFFDDTYMSSIGVKVSQKLLPPIESKNDRLIQYNFLLWDIEGAETENITIHNYLAGAKGALIVSDLTRVESIDAMTSLVETFSKTCSDGHLILIGNKVDIFIPETETITRLEATARELGARYLLTSAKTGENVELAFTELAKLLSESE